MYLYTNGIFSSSGEEVIPFSDDYSFEFDGVSDYINLGRVTSMENASSFSISMWFYPTSYSSINNLFGKFASGTDMFYAYTQVTSGEIYFVISNGQTGYPRVLTSTSVSLNTWALLTFVYDGSLSGNLNRGKIYIDGMLASNSTGASSMPQILSLDTSDFYIGKANGLTPMLEGNINEVSVYNYALTSSDVSTIYGLGVPTSLSSLYPVGWWREENATFNGSNWDIVDSGSGGNDATSVSMTLSSRSTDVPLFDNKSFEFDGVGDYVDCGNQSNLNFSADNTFSFSVWFRKGSQTGFGGSLFRKQQSSGLFTGYNMWVSDNKVNFRIRRSSSNFHQIVDNNTHPIDNWVHYVVTYDGSRTGSGGGLNLYKNGTLLTDVTRSGDFTIGAGQSTESLGIGGDSSTGYISSKIDELSVFNTELSASDVTTIYNSGVPNDISSLSPLSWWREESATFDGSNWDITDSGSGGNDATSVSMTLSSRSTDVPT